MARVFGRGRTRPLKFTLEDALPTSRFIETIWKTTFVGLKNTGTNDNKWWSGGVVVLGSNPQQVFQSLAATQAEVWEADSVYLTMWDLSMLCVCCGNCYVNLRLYPTMFLCVLWDLSAILCTCLLSCVPVHIT
ncbi:hypothetical protein Bbelb_188750 [Branchiostoma belcheri]|nr:hypothetical protein Bbelb_188750 [Branchiostoma belcheri]